MKQGLVHGATLANRAICFKRSLFCESCGTVIRSPRFAWWRVCIRPLRCRHPIRFSPRPTSLRDDSRRRATGHTREPAGFDNHHETGVARGGRPNLHVRMTALQVLITRFLFLFQILNLYWLVEFRQLAWLGLRWFTASASREDIGRSRVLQVGLHQQGVFENGLNQFVLLVVQVRLDQATG